MEASLKSSCPGSHRWGTFDRIGQSVEARGNASIFLQESVNSAGRFRQTQPHLFQGLIATKTSRGSPWDLGYDLGLRGDHPGSPTPDPPPVGRAEAGDDEVPVNDRAAPAHRLWAHSRAVFSRYATQLIDIPVAWANWGREKSRMLAIASAANSLALRSRLLP